MIIIIYLKKIFQDNPVLDADRIIIMMRVASQPTIQTGNL